VFTLSASSTLHLGHAGSGPEFHLELLRGLRPLRKKCKIDDRTGPIAGNGFSGGRAPLTEENVVLPSYSDILKTFGRRSGRLLLHAIKPIAPPLHDFNLFFEEFVERI
jgi:hypothetical protein